MENEGMGFWTTKWINDQSSDLYRLRIKNINEIIIFIVRPISELPPGAVPDRRSLPIEGHPASGVRETPSPKGLLYGIQQI
jgi:hypothetical protein